MGFEGIQNKIVILDGAMGTVLQQRGLPPGGQPELLNLTEPAMLRSVYEEYVDAGSQVVYTNTFGANGLKLERTGHSVDEIVTAAVKLAKEAVGSRALVALDIGPLGELLEPMGSLPFERAYDLFREMAEAGARAGADLAVIETMTDLYEAKAALLAVKEHTDLPAFVTMSFEPRGRTFTGCTVASMARTLEGLGADAIGLNCSLGPDMLAPMLKEVCENTRLPVIAKPNAGLPDPVDGHYDMGPEAFAAALAPCLDLGVTLFGGCCGTSPAYIRAVAAALKGKTPSRRHYDAVPFVCTATEPLRLDGVRDGDKIRLNWDVEDLAIRLIHPRKLNIQAMVSFVADVQEQKTLLLPVGAEGADSMSFYMKEKNILGICVHRKDTLRLREEIVLPANKQDVEKILWQDIQVRGLKLRCGEGEILYKGEMFVFLLYAGEDPSSPPEWIEEIVPVSGSLDCEKCETDMLPNIEVRMAQSQITVKPDANGEERMLTAEAVMDVDLRLEKEQHFSILMDAYDPTRECTPVSREEDSM